MIIKTILSWLTIAIIGLSLYGCNDDTIETVQAFEDTAKPPLPQVEKIAEVPPPPLINQLNKHFAKTKPQVKIISPAPDEVINSQEVTVKLEVKGLNLFKNEELQMGPHLHFFVDDQPYRAIYNTDEPIILSDLAPGTHTLRVFASRPWHESFKNRGAYAKTTFHVFTVTEENNPSSNQPLLTYSRPQGVYGAQPIMLDFYLTDAPLHVVAQESPDDDIADWRIRVTINGESFLLDQWQPIYLEGFDKGQNWVKLEFIDENGDLIKNVFNSTVRAITYDPQLNDTLSQLVKGKISLEKAQAITIANYQSAEKEEISTQTPKELAPAIEEVIEPIVEEANEETIIEEEITTQDTPEEKNIIEETVENNIPEIMIEDNLSESSSSDVNDSIVNTEDLESTEEEEVVKNQQEQTETFSQPEDADNNLEIEPAFSNTEKESFLEEDLLTSQ